MKLWQKITLICVIMLLIVAGACSGISLIQSKRAILNLAIESAMMRQENMAAAFGDTIKTQLTPGMSDTTKRSIIRYYFETFAANQQIPGATLIIDGETVYANTHISLEELLPLGSDEYQPQSIQTTIEGRNYLVTGIAAPVNKLGVGFATMYTITDITGLYDTINQMAVNNLLVSLACVAAGVVIVIVAVQLATRPLKKLSNAAREIASGDFGKRVRIESADEVGDLASDFNTMANAVEEKINELHETAERQQLFIGGLTHEFKTPLASVIGHAETLLYTKQPEEITASSLTHIHEQCRWLERLTQRLLSLITMKTTPDLRTHSVSHLLKDVHDSVHETFAQRGTKLELDCTADTLRFEYDLILSALINLADNASKASHPGQTVQIHAFENILEVQDEGAGIPPEELHRITEPFYMVDRSRSKQKGGSGLGVFVKRKMVQSI